MKKWYQESIESRLETEIKVIIHREDYYHFMNNNYTTIWHRARKPRGSTTYFDIYKNGEIRSSSWLKPNKNGLGKTISKIYWHGLLTLSDQIFIREVVDAEVEIGQQDPDNKFGSNYKQLWEAKHD
jgi:hypothetical protein